MEQVQKRLLISNEIFLCEASVDLIRIGDAEGLEVLEAMNVNTGSFESIMAAINRRRTALELLDAKQRTNEKNETVSFEKILASVEIQLGYQVKPEKISLARWVGILDTLRMKNEANKEATKNNRR